MSSLYQQVAFFNEMEKLKTITRQNKTLDGRFENSAEHSWQLALMAILLQEHFPKTINLELVLKMLLVHDMGEIGAGDTSVFDDAGKSTSYARELESVKKSLSYLDDSDSEQLLNLWIEFEKGTSDEARFARCVDAIAPLMNHLQIAEENDNPDDLTYNQVLSKKSFIAQESDSLWQLTLDLLDASLEKGLYRDDRVKSV
ncbi:HD domain-containing protein [Streptococcus loxodontisalivarius]|uniref:5'-deoxynucleotidase n=1 Tax=Streptococcus loxodontisalivarius TaxID=1349415 RepID=A0ABS2PTF7_9STRE|nr:HD domain-containing protein [Streptococcus loxodontisalivarius]MBM7643314.1 putative hydrolase of HD superfamily [Streptococcus loxodontisalivarius]